MARVRWWEVVAALGLFLVLFGVLCFPVRADGGPARRSACVTSMRQTTTAILVYAGDTDDRLPPSERWLDGARPYAKERVAFRCPSVSEYGYAFNSGLSARPLTKVGEPGTTPMAYDSTNLSKNAADRLTSLPNPGRHTNSAGTRLDTIGYADGHARMRMP